MCELIILKSCFLHYESVDLSNFESVNHSSLLVIKLNELAIIIEFFSFLKIWINLIECKYKISILVSLHLLLLFWHADFFNENQSTECLVLNFCFKCCYCFVIFCKSFVSDQLNYSLEWETKSPKIQKNKQWLCKRIESKFSWQIQILPGTRFSNGIMNSW